MLRRRISLRLLLLPCNFYSSNFCLLSTQAKDVEIISRETIKPCRITSHMKTYKLSLLDQIIPYSSHFPLVLFYLNNQNPTPIDVIRKILKHSLSKTLSHFYPLAGKIKDDLWIDCNDEGAYFVEARVNYPLSQLLGKPDFQLTQRLAPNEADIEPPTSGVYPVMIQLNVFKCGGVALTLSTSHKIMDGCTVGSFLKTWVASIASPDQGLVHDRDYEYTDFHIASSLFPQNTLLPKDSKLFMWPALFERASCVTRRFVFNGLDLVALKARAASASFVQSPTRIEAVLGLLWKCASKARYGSKKPSVFSQVIDLRRRMWQPLHGCPIGNFIWLAVAQSMPNTQVPLTNLVSQLRKAKANVDNHFVPKLQGNDKGFLKVSEGIKELGELYTKDEVDCFFASTFCRSSVYEADFGWGKPIWVMDGTAGEDHQSFHFFLMDTRFGDGIEAWVSLTKQEMALFECDPEILEFASLDPSPLKLTNPVFSGPSLTNCQEW